MLLANVTVSDTVELGPFDIVELVEWYGGRAGGDFGGVVKLVESLIFRGEIYTMRAKRASIAVSKL